MLWHQPHIPFIGFVSWAPAACKNKKTLMPQRLSQAIRCKPSSRQIVSNDQNIYRTAKNHISSRETMLNSLTTPVGTGKDPHGEVKQSCWSLPVWCPQEISVLVLKAWALGRKGSSPSWLSQKWSAGSSTPHPPSETCSSHTHLQWKDSKFQPRPGQVRATKTRRIIWAKAATGVARWRGQPVLEPTTLHPRHRGHIQACTFSVFHCSLEC